MTYLDPSQHPNKPEKDQDLERNFQLPDKGLQCTIQGFKGNETEVMKVLWTSMAKGTSRFFDLVMMKSWGLVLLDYVMWSDIILSLVV